jgi:hypothetical protein
VKSSRSTPLKGINARGGNTLIKWVKEKIIWVEFLYGHKVLGALTLVAGWIHPVYAALWVLLYLVYEIVEDYWIRDKGYIDIRDFYEGFGIGVVSVFLWRLICSI